MFELLSDVHTVPVDQDALVMIHHGMNKVRVSVGEHNSEPSEVFIITGQADGNLETYIIFYILAPEVHIVYGFDQNPYAPELQEKVVEEAVDFVEEMGSILEEVPLKTMTPDQRSAWFDREALYSEPIVMDLEEVQELEELQAEQIEEPETDEALLLEDVDLDDLEDFVKVSDADVREAMSEDSTGEGFHEPDQPDEDMDRETDSSDEIVERGVEAAGEDNVVVAEGDFDELLKQAFLKPDVVEKTRRKGGVEEEKPEAEEFLPDEFEAASDGGFSTKAESPIVESEEDEDDGMFKEHHVTTESDTPAETETGGTGGETASDETRNITSLEDHGPAEGEAALKVIRFLSKY